VVKRLREFLGQPAGQHPPQTGKAKPSRQPAIRSGSINTKATTTRR
jgi:hypothetical protein